MMIDELLTQRQDNKKPKARPPDWAYHFEEANKGIS